ncbi:MAG: hypothetical protein Q9170_005570, partial [Blastenia crenularia]
MRLYEPNAIECGTIDQPFNDDKCDLLLQNIPAEISPKKTWGPEGQAGVDGVLPYSFKLI